MQLIRFGGLLIVASLFICALDAYNENKCGIGVFIVWSLVLVGIASKLVNKMQGR